MKEEILKQGSLGKVAANKMANVSILKRNMALELMAEELRKNSSLIIEANKKDMISGEENGLTKSLLDRLMLNEDRVEAMAAGLENLVRLEDPIGQVKKMWKRPNDLEIGAMSVSIGLVGMIYEARPNVTVEASGICIKTGNGVILKGSSSAYYSNKKIVEILQIGCKSAGLPDNVIQLIASKDREAVNVLMKMNDYLDVIIPRGGAGLIKNVVNNSTVPVIETGAGNCHAYVDEEADFNMAIDIVINGKVQRPSVCNSLEKVLVSRKIADKFVPLLIEELKKNQVEIRGYKDSMSYLASDSLEMSDEELYAEYLDYIIGLVLVDDVEDAAAFINKYSTKHSEVIITDSYENGRTFQSLVDSSCVYHNASTRFSDGEMFGFGAEIGISTQKIHARGPMGLDALTSIKYIINGNGQIR